MNPNIGCFHLHYPDFIGVECAWPAVLRPTPNPAAAPRRDGLMRRLLLLAAAVALAAGLWQIGHAGYIHAKARLAQLLIARAWAQTQAGEVNVKPWPWADTWPVAHLTAPAQGVDLYVLAGAEGRSLAFGPGHVYGTPLPGEAGNSVIGGHRDTHFAFLEQLERGDELDVDTPHGEHARYRVTGGEVVHKDDLDVLAQPAEGAYLTLVTCYPFDAVRPGGPLRYAVTAVRM